MTRFLLNDDRVKDKKIACVHLLNDYSGSPLIFSMAIKGLLQAGNEVTVYTSKIREGFLTGLNVTYRYIPYNFHKNKWIRLIKFFYSQLYLFFLIVLDHRKIKQVYVNTLLPFGAAVAGKVCRKKVSYHLHESYLQPQSLKKFLQRVASYTAEDALYVSNYLMKTEPLKGVRNSIVYNALPDEFVNKAKQHIYHPVNNNFTVLMICSLKAYKGVNEFVSLAKRFPSLNFEMVLNANEKDIETHFLNVALPSNLKLFTVQSDVHPFYQRASLVLNLSNPENCVETFGMTLLEAMCYGIPVIAPPVGGPAELVSSSVNGFCIDVRNTDQLDKAIEKISNDITLQNKISQKARATALKFSEKSLQHSVVNTLLGTLESKQ